MHIFLKMTYLISLYLYYINMSVVVHYFDSLGRGERIRWLLMSNDIEFTNKHYTSEEWFEARPNIEFGQLPVVEIDGHTLVQSLVIEKYIARKINIVPQDSFQEYLVDSLIGCFDDFLRYYADFFFFNRDLDGFINYYNNELKKNFKDVEARIDKHGTGGFAVGNSRTLADYAIAEYIYDCFLSGPRKGVLGPLIEQGNPKLVEFTNNFIQSYPKLSSYLSTRSDREY